jgi:hypothetical protein
MTVAVIDDMAVQTLRARFALAGIELHAAADDPHFACIGPLVERLDTVAKAEEFLQALDARGRSV